MTSKNLRFGSFMLAGVMALGTAALAAPSANHDAALQAGATERLQQKDAFKSVHSSVQDGTVTLSGTVQSYKDKLNAEKRVRKDKAVKAVRNLITVAGPAVPDLELRDRLARTLRYDRSGYLFGNVFNFLTVGVQDGVVTLGGEVRTPMDHDSTLDAVASTKGVKGVVDKVKVAPASHFDDELRLRLLRAIYGEGALQRYGIDPEAPIRIVVDNGHVALYGVVDSNVDRQVAGMRAGQVFGAFSVENNLLTTREIAR